MLQVDTSGLHADTGALRSTARRLRDEAAAGLEQAIETVRRHSPARGIAAAFDRYGSLPAYQAVSTAWLDELRLLADVVRRLADDLDSTAAGYEATDLHNSRVFGSLW